MATKYTRDDSPPTTTNTNTSSWHTSRTRAWLEKQHPAPHRAHLSLWLLLPLVVVLYLGGKSMEKHFSRSQSIAAEGHGVITSIDIGDDGLARLGIDLTLQDGAITRVIAATTETVWEINQPVRVSYEINPNAGTPTVTALTRSAPLPETPPSP